MNLDTTDFEDWVLAGDFNLIRHPENRNKPGGDISEMNMFNELISDLDLVEIPFSGRNFSWSNMQDDPLLVKLDWVFTSASWTISFPATFVQPLPRPISDHIPYVLHIGSSIPKFKMFRFENFWVDHPGFIDTVSLHWNSSTFYANAAKNLSVKLKQVRAGLKTWSKNLSNLSKLIYNCNWVLLLLDGLEDQRPLSKLESAFRALVKNHLASLLESKRAYWKQRNSVDGSILGMKILTFFILWLPFPTKETLLLLVDGRYSKNKPSTLLAQILEIKHHHRFRSFKLTNSTSFGEYLHASEFSHSTGQIGP